MRRTDALSIPYSVKQAVADRDCVEGWPCCILCGKPAPSRAPLSFSCAHFIARSQGGLGIEENILTLCPTCHREYDQTDQRKVLRPILAKHLRENYKSWSEDQLTYKKEGYQ